MKSQALALAGVIGVIVLTIATVTARPLAQQAAEKFGQGAFYPGDGISPPKLVRQVTPRYTPDALNRGVKGEVEVEAVVKADGTVGDVRVTKSLDSDLDAQAVKAAHDWVFTPGHDRAGNAVPVIVTIVLSFREGLASEFAGPEFAKGTCRAGASGTTEPKILHQTEAAYTSDALRAKIAGTVTVEAVIGADGKVMRSRVSKSLDTIYGLDHEALKAVNQWTFEPDSGKCQGLPAPVLMTFDVPFRLH